MNHARETMAEIESALANLRLARECLTPRPAGAHSGAAYVNGLLQSAHGAVARAAGQFAAHNAGEIKESVDG